jgi:hypothetical protein
VAGTLSAFVRGTAAGTASADGTYVEYATAGSDTDAIKFTADSSFRGKIDDVSIVEVESIPADFTFTRGTNLTATRVGKDGYIEKGRENLLLQSNNFGTTWTTANASVTGGQTGYDGSSDAWLLQNNSGPTTTAVVQQSLSLGSSVRSFSVYAKAGNVNWLRILVYDGATTYVSWFNLTDGSTANESNIIDAKSTSVGGGWYRCEISANTNITYANIYPSIVAGSSLSDNGDNIYIQDAQLEVGLAATDYIETGATTATAGLLENEPRFDYSGGGCPALLLEPSRTNLVDYSEYASGNSSANQPTLVENYAISPEGLQNAFQISTDAVTFRRVRKILTGLSGNTSYSMSVFVKKATNAVSTYGGFGMVWQGGTQNINYIIFDEYAGTMSILQDQTGNTATKVDDVGDYWRFSVGATDTGTNTSFEAAYYPCLSSTGTTIGTGAKSWVGYGLQLEEGSYPTSYIPTYGSATTRGVDNPIISSAGDIIDINQGTLFIDATIDSNVDTEIYLMKFDGVNFNDTLYFYRSPIGMISGVYRIGGSAYVQQTTSAISGRLKAVFAYDSSNECTLYVNGSKVGSSFSIPTPSVNLTAIRLGGFNDTLAKQSGLTHQSLYFPTVLSNNDCEILTGTSYTSFASMASTLSYTQYE